MVILVIGTLFYFIAINGSDSSAEMAVPSPQSTAAASPEQMAPDGQILDDNSGSENNLEPAVNTKSFSSEVKTSSASSANSLFNHLLQEDKMFTKKNVDGTIELFYYYTKEERTGDQIEIELEEGDINSYQIHTIGGKNYYPLILGMEEAEMMKDEGFFTEVGDPIKDFFGKNVVVVGIMKKTNGVLDLAHLTPLNSGEWN